MQGCGLWSKVFWAVAVYLFLSWRRELILRSKQRRLKELNCTLCSEEFPPFKSFGACESCTLTHFQPGKRPLYVRTANCEWNCEICSAHQAIGTVYRRFRTCGLCWIILDPERDDGNRVPDACLIRDAVAVLNAKLVSLDQEAVAIPKLHFIQQIDPSPLSNDFKGDVSFVVKGDGGDQCIQAHQYILASKSPVFKAMMNHDMKEKLTRTIQIENMSAAVVRAAVNFMYIGEIEFNDQVVPEDMLEFSHQYDIPLLKKSCEDELVKRITSTNFVDMLSISYRFNAQILKATAKRWFHEHPSDHEIFIEKAFGA